LVQRFEFPLVEHLLRSPRRHTYRSIRFRWTHCEKPRFGVGRPSPVRPVGAIGSVLGGTGLTGAPHRSDRCGPEQTQLFWTFKNHFYINSIFFLESYTLLSSFCDSR
jgi:hypothetical protein